MRSEQEAKTVLFMVRTHVRNECQPPRWQALRYDGVDLVAVMHGMCHH